MPDPSIKIEDLRIHQYSGPWAITPDGAKFFRAEADAALKDIWSHALSFRSRLDEGHHSPGGGYEVTPDGVAVIDLEGTLTKYGSSLSTAGSTVRFRQVLRRVRSAFDSGQVKAALLNIESPGGSTMGTPEAAEEVAKLASVMPVWTYFEDIGASAAYWIGCQATRVISNGSALVGSIGTYFMVDDVSKALEMKGIETLLFTTGVYKGAGTLGTEVTEKQRAEFQSLVERMNKPFVEAVASARGLEGEDLENVIDGRVWRGDEAVAMGLIDEVMSYDDALEALSNTVNGLQPNKEPAMSKPKVQASAKSAKLKAKSEEDKEPEAAEDDEEMESEEEETTESNEDEKPKMKKKAKSQEEEDEDEEDGDAPASIARLRAAFPKASSDFILQAVESKMTMRDAEMAFLKDQVKSQSEQIKELKAQSGRPGARPLGGKAASASQITDAKSAWKSAIKAKMEETGMDKRRATSAVVSEQPELQQAYIDACNAG